MIIRKTTPNLKPSANEPFITAMIIPTGVSATQGGFAGDAGIYLQLIASVSDWVVTHPNVCNAAGFVALPENALYVEGAMLDAWLRGTIALRPVRTNTIAVIFDAGMPTGEQILHHNVINAIKTVYGLDILAPVLTAAPLALTCEISAKSQASGGTLNNPDVLLDAAAICLNQGATAIAICGYFEGLSEGLDEDNYKAGNGTDPIGGLEAILSHTVAQHFGVPCAHAPVLNVKSNPPETREILAGKVAAEFITPSFLPCVLQGLARAPQIIDSKEAKASDLRVDALQAVVTPVDALGGPGVLAALLQNIPIIPVGSNQTQMAISPTTLKPFMQNSARVLPASSYLEAVGQIQALKLGLTLPRHFTASV